MSDDVDIEIRVDQAFPGLVDDVARHLGYPAPRTVQGLEHVLTGPGLRAVLVAELEEPGLFVLMPEGEWSQAEALAVFDRLAAQTPWDLVLDSDDGPVRSRAARASA